jgi:hypothetical protein
MSDCSPRYVDAAPEATQGMFVVSIPGEIACTTRLTSYMLNIMHMLSRKIIHVEAFNLRVFP